MVEPHLRKGGGSMNIIAIDPGDVQSAILVWNGQQIDSARIIPNNEVRDALSALTWADTPPLLAIEMVACYGMPVGKTIFETVLRTGRFVELWHPNPCRLVYRREVKMHHCGNMHAKDANISQSLRDKYGEKGTKKTPGLTYGLKEDLWSAFAIATFISKSEKIASQQPNLIPA